MTTSRVAVIGGGNMARAIIEGGMRAGARGPESWIVVEPDEVKRCHFEGIGVRCLINAGGLAGDLNDGDQVLLAVKPQMLETVAQESTGVDFNRVVISILAGMPSPRIRKALGGSARIIRVMPNLPAQLGEGATAVARGAGAKPGDETLAIELFSAVGPVVVKVPEDLIDAFTAVAGSGPAYVFYLAEAMTKAAVELGFTIDQADQIVRQTIIGSAAMLNARSESPENLRAAVTSKGGTTAAATAILDKAQVIDTFMRALKAARDRGRALGDE